MIVASCQQHPAMRRAAIGVAVLDGIDGAVNTRTLAVPEREHTIDRGFRLAFCLLCAGNDGGGQIFIHRGNELDRMRVQMLVRAPQFLIKRGQRRAAVTADHATCFQPGSSIKACLVQHQAYHGLCAVQKHPA